MTKVGKNAKSRACVKSREGHFRRSGSPFKNVSGSMRRLKISNPHFICLTLAFTALTGAGCLGGEPSETQLQGPPQRLDATSVSQAQLRLNLQAGDPSLAHTALGPVRLRVRSALSGQIVDMPLINVLESWPQEVVFDPPFQEQMVLTVYIDLDGDEQFDACPFPRGITPAPNLDSVDSIMGEAFTPAASNMPVEIKLHRVFCGPGTLETGMSGTALAERALVESGLEELFVYIEPLSESATPIRIRLEQPNQEDESGVDGSSLMMPFSIGELLPGAYRVTVFNDDDKDGHPTPCSAALGGGDRVVSTPIELDVDAGERIAVPEPLRLLPRECATLLTGLAGRLTLSGQAQLSVQDSIGGPLPVLEGATHLALSQPNSSEAMISYKIFDSVRTRPLPQDFTVTGLPEGLWRIVFFVDRDANGRFAPCDAIPAGFDRLYAIKEEVRITPDTIIQVGAVELTDGDCGNAPPTGLRGSISAERELGAVGSGRPIRMELYPTFEGGERLGFMLFENHWRQEGELSVFTQEVPAGSYQARIYLDTDRNGDYTGCDVDSFADRASSPLFSVVLEAGQLLDLGHFALDIQSCPVPQARIELSLDPADGLQPDFNRMRVMLEEAGGWQEDRELSGRDVRGIWVADPTLVAPGDYRLVVYEDRDGSGSFESCTEQGEDRISVSAEVSLDGITPRLTATLLLSSDCR